MLARLSQHLAARMGLHFPPERWNELQRGVAATAKEFELGSPMACADWLMASRMNRQQVEMLASNLTVGETCFFRERQSFDILQMEILPEIIRRRRGGDQRLRIWSAGCCTGEEPYSIAIILRQILPDLADWNVTILATDINPRFLHKAAEGVYGEWSFRDAPEWARDRCFHKVGKSLYQIRPEIKAMVTCNYLNLADDLYPSLLNNTNAMDAIFCRNVLMYFAPGQARKVIRGLHHALVDGGWLLVSPSDFPHVHVPSFAVVSYPGAILYQKVLQREPVAPHEETVVCSGQGIQPEAADVLTDGSGNSAEPQVIARLARAYADQGRLAEALAACERAVATDTLTPSHHYLRAMILQEQGAADEARSSLKRALYLDPRLVVVHFALGNLARAEGCGAEALRHFSNATRLLCAYEPEDLLPEAGGITAGRLATILATMKEREFAS